MIKYKLYFQRLLEFFLIAVFLFSCSNLRYSKNKLNLLLQNKRVFNFDNSFSVGLPSGFIPVVENKFNSSDIFLIKNDYSETLSINKINIKGRLDFLSFYDLILEYHKLNFGGKLNNFKNFIFEIDKKQISGFSYIDNKEKIVFVFPYLLKNNFFEIVLTKNNEIFSPVVLAIINSLNIS